MSQIPEKKIHSLDLMVSRIEKFSPTLFMLELGLPEGDSTLPSSLPGQFLQIRIPNCDGVFLRRPLSIYHSDERHIRLLIQVAGKGSRHLYDSREGDSYNVLYPLGNHFPDPQGRSPLLVGGGVGLAPLLSMGEHLKGLGIDPSYLLGGRTAGAFPDLTDFRSLGKVSLTTEDGSLELKGMVTDHSLWSDFHFSDVYCCGPTPMMKAVAQKCKELNVPCYVSLENLMACGVGVCLCCVEPTVEGHKCVCKDGPVFNVNDLLW